MNGVGESECNRFVACAYDMKPRGRVLTLRIEATHWLVLCVAFPTRMFQGDSL